MTDPEKRRNPVEELAESFLARYRRGERPALSEYIERHPELAADIRDLFPALVMMEEAGPPDGKRPGPGGGPVTAGDRRLEQLGDYRILREVGRGGMGVVYEAEQESLGRHVALKVLPSQALLDPKQVQRFQREAKAAARLHHTNIVPVFGVGEEGGLPYYVMQFIQGLGLDAVLDELKRLRKLRNGQQPPGPTPPWVEGDKPSAAAVAQALLSGSFARNAPPEPPAAEAATPRPAPLVGGPAAADSSTAIHLPGQADHATLSESGRQYWQSVARIGLQVAEALAHAHGQGILHRDIKPSNLLLDTHGTVWVTDFGLAKADDSDDLTQTGDIVGTLRYMAPERLQGQSDPRSDLYGLGITLYELLTLRPAFAAADRNRLYQRVLHEEPTRPRRVNPEVPRDLETVVLKAIAKEPKQRYTNAEHVAEDLRRFLADRPIQARRSAAWEHAWRWCRRNPAVASLSVGLALMALMATVVSVVAALRLGHAAEQAERTQRDAQEQLCDSLFVQAHAGRTSQRPGQRLDSLKALERAAQLGRTLGRGPADFVKWRDEAVACLALPDVRLEQEWEGHPPGTNGLGFDARFERYAWSFQDEGLRIRRVQDQQELLRLPTLPAERVSRWLIPRFSPDGRFLAVWYAVWANKRPLEVWELQPGVSRPLILLADAATQPEFSPDGRSLAVGLPDNSLCLFDLATGQQTTRVALDLIPERLAFHPDGEKLAISSTTPSGSGSAAGQVQVRALQSGRTLYTLPHPAGVQAVAWHPQGRLLATGCDDRRIYLWDGVNGAQRGVFEGHSWEVHDLAFSQSGDWLASFGWDMTLRLWDVATGKPLWHLEDVRVIGFRPEEPLQAAAISGRQVRLWACVPSTEFHVLRGPTKNIRGATSSPDGRYLACATYGGEGFLWDADRQREVEGFSSAQCFSWDPKGNLWLITKEGQLLRRPVRGLRHGGDQLDSGPAEVLLSHSLEPGVVHDFGGFDWDRRLLWIVSASPIGRVQMIAMDGTARQLWSQPVANALTMSVDPEGRWVSVGTYDGGRGVAILDARTGKLVKELEIGDALAVFSRDGRWLVTTTGRLTTPEGECCLWRTDTWEKERAQPLRRSSSSPAALRVSPDGALLAVAYTMSEVRLLRLETLEEMVTLTAPELGLIESMQFSPDGRRLFVSVANTVHVWDLDALRRGLRGIDLDWDLPADSPGGDRS